MENITRELVEAKFPNLKNLEAEHGKLTVIAVEDKMALFKKPSRQILSQATALSASDPIGYVELLAKNCKVAGDDALIDDDQYFLGIIPHLNELVEVKTSQLLKL